MESTAEAALPSGMWAIQSLSFSLAPAEIEFMGGSRVGESPSVYQFTPAQVLERLLGQREVSVSGAYGAVLLNEEWSVLDAAHGSGWYPNDLPGYGSGEDRFRAVVDRFAAETYISSQRRERRWVHSSARRQVRPLAELIIELPVSVLGSPPSGYEALINLVAKAKPGPLGGIAVGGYLAHSDRPVLAIVLGTLVTVVWAVGPSIEKGRDIVNRRLGAALDRIDKDGPRSGR